MRILVIFILICSSSFSKAMECHDPNEDLKRARYYRDALNTLTNTKKELAAENRLIFDDSEGKKMILPISEIADTWGERLQFLIDNCKVSPVQLGFGLEGKSEIERMEMAANRHLLDLKKQALANTHFTDNADGINQVRKLEQKIGHRPHMIGEDVENEKKAMTQSSARSLKAAQQLSSTSQCTYKDFRPRLPPVRDQADSGLCWAYAAADMASFKLGKDISPLGMAIPYNRSKMSATGPSGTMDVSGGGNIQDAVNQGVQQGMCLNENFGGRTHFNPLILKSAGASTSNQDEFDLLREVERVNSLATLSDKTAALAKLYPANSCTAFSEASKNYFGLGYANITEVLKHEKAQDPIFALYDKVCAANKVPADFKVYNLFVNKGDGQAIPAIDEELDQGNIIGISYNLLDLDTPRSDKIAGHGSTIVGRRMNDKTGVCEYLVRNSWGPNCELYSEVRGTSFDCTDGHVWLPIDVVEKSVFTLTRFKPRQEEKK